MPVIITVLIGMLFLFWPVLAMAAVPAALLAGPLSLDGRLLSLWWCVPFAGILLSIALLPVLAPRFWHRHYGGVSAFWAAALLLPLGWHYGVTILAYNVGLALLYEYIPFIALVGGLYVISSGVAVTGAISGRPLSNLVLLLVGTLLASVMGTAGAAMLMIHPLLRANAWRRHVTHIYVFFIFLVANIGGSLTPVGDPPLFLGFLRGVDFFWPTMHMLLPMLLVAGCLLLIFYLLECHFFARELAGPPPFDPNDRLGLRGRWNLLLLAGVVGAVILSGVWKPGIYLVVGGLPLALQDLVRTGLILLLAFCSYRFTPKQLHAANHFSWLPVLEVGKLFVTIFITILPVLAILRAGEAGALAWVLSGLRNEAGEPVAAAYFWLAGILSAFLDNAPTYAVFFEAAGGNAATLMADYPLILLAISCGSVFMGALTYIGNAPNFMVRAVAEDRGVRMPSFFGFLGWSCLFLLPVMGLLTLVFFV